VIIFGNCLHQIFLANSASLQSETDNKTN